MEEKQIKFTIDRGEKINNSGIGATVSCRRQFKNPAKKRDLSPFFNDLKRKREDLQNRGTLSQPSENDTGLPENIDNFLKPAIIPAPKVPNSETVDDQFNAQVEETAEVDFAPSTKSYKVKTPVQPPSSVTNEITLLSNPKESATVDIQPSNTKYYSALWAKASTRKHKKWEADGYLFVTGKAVVLKNTTGKVLESSSNYKLEPDTLEDGKIIKLGGKEVEIQELLTSNPFKDKPEPEPIQEVVVKKLPKKLTTRPFVLPCAPPTGEKPSTDITKPVFDPDAPNALVMPKLYSDETVKVVVDPHLSRHLRKHQKDGVSFLYKCLENRYNNGAILADEMGLGKTLQCIAILWTLMKQSGYGRKDLIKRALIVTPSSLVSNWEKEFNFWLGNERIRVFTVNSDHPLKHYPPNCPVLIISYDMVTRSEDALKKMKFDMMICDEAHKIKNSNGQAYTILYSLSCRKRILLTGTPIQNDLMELFSLVDFANPGILGKDYDFRREYEKPIAKFQEKNSVDSGRQCVEALRLQEELKEFFLRRGHEVMMDYLPPKVTSIVICKPTELQINLYSKILSSKYLQDDLRENALHHDSSLSALSIILALKKICNHPNLVHLKAQTKSGDEASVLYKELVDVFPSGYRHQHHSIDLSGKMKVLVSMLNHIKSLNEKVVLVSHYVTTLDIFEEMCQTYNYTFKRLDGGTQSKIRLQIVDQFNKSPNEFLFLLSSKAGGIGLNLQGASNIILYDIDWNPAHDVQAMARCWRPGQKKETHIYRLITSGTIEEKMYHRQITKMDLSGSVMDMFMSNATIKFSTEELKDIFTLHEGGYCLTHDLLQCDCECDGKNIYENVDEGNIENVPPPSKKHKTMSTMGELSRWEHLGPPFLNLSDCLVCAKKDLEFVFRNHSSKNKQLTISDSSE